MEPYYLYILIISITFLLFVYYIYTRMYGLFAIYNCVTTDMLWKIGSGKIFNCFRGEPKTCKNIDKYSIYGFCYDPDYYGVGIGEEKGPYGYNCSDWVFSKDDCYPETCELANVSNRFGWCVDYNRAYRGTSCGPDKLYGITCKKWIWNDPSKCPRKCPKPTIKTMPKCPRKKKIPKCPIKDKCICE
jgi:hypothetical protein